MEVLLERPSEGVVLLRINRPEARNALNSAVREQLAGCFTDLAQGEKIRCVVITGSDKVFVAGADSGDGRCVACRHAARKRTILETYQRFSKATDSSRERQWRLGEAANLPCMRT